MQRREWLNRRKWMQRKPPKDTGPSLRVRHLVHKRSGGRCEFPFCGLPATCIHHRYERKSGGFGPKSPAIDWINEPPNLLDACRQHNDWASNGHPQEAHDMGWLWQSGDPPAAEFPVQTCHCPVPVYLNFDHTWTSIEERKNAA